MKLTKHLSAFFLLVLISLLACDMNSTNAQHTNSKAWEQDRDKWVDSTYNSLNQEQRIAQLLMIAAYSGGPKQNDSLIEHLIRQYHIGGLIFMQGTATAQALQTNYFQKISKVPLLIGMDAEWGLGMRLTGIRNFPRQMLLGASNDTQLVYELGAHIADQLQLLGVHFNFGPVVDVNNNPLNPVINFRSFGASPALVARLGIAYAKGMQDKGVLASAKHFPGHGDVDVDSHIELPVVNKTKDALLQTELYPFQQLVKAGVSSIMVAHLSIPHLDSSKVPSTLSYNIVTKLLKEEMGYEGLIITDALNMEGVAKYYPVGDVDLKAFLAGNDILLFSQDVPKAIAAINKAMQAGEISEERLAYSVKKILRQKYQVGLHSYKALDTTNLNDKINIAIDSFFYKAAQKSTTGISIDASILNLLNSNPTSGIACLAINGKNEAFLQLLKQQYPGIKVIQSPADIKKYAVVIASVSNLTLYPGKDQNYGLSTTAIQQMKALAIHPNVVKVVFGNAYTAKYLCGQNNLLLAYEDNAHTQQVALDILAGKQAANGTLPVEICPKNN